MNKPVLSRSILSSYLWSVSSLAVSKGLRFAGVVLCIRLVGDFAWGEVASTVAAMSFATLFIDQGLNGSPLLYRLQDRAADAKLLGVISLYRTALALAVILGIHLVHGWTGSPGPLLLAYSFVLIPRALATEWWFHRREYYQVNMVVGAIRTLVFFALIALAVRKSATAQTVIYVEMASEAVSVLCSYAFMGLAKARIPAGTGAPVRLWPLLTFSFPLLLMSLLATIWNYSDILMLGYFCGKEEVAQYDIGMKVCVLYFFLGGTIVQIIKPKLTRLSENGDAARVGEILRAVSGSLLLLGSLVLIPSLYFPSESVSFLFGRDSDLAAFVFRWAALWVNVSFMTILTADTLLALGHRRKYLAGAWCCAVVNVAANAALLQGFSAYGAVFAKVLSEATFLVVSLLQFPAAIRRELSGALKFQALVLTALMGGYLASELTESRFIWMAASLAGIAAAFLSGRLINRRTLEVLRQN